MKNRETFSRILTALLLNFLVVWPIYGQIEIVYTKAYDVRIDNVNYKLNDENNTAKVIYDSLAVIASNNPNDKPTYRYYSLYSGRVIIPEKITANNKDYAVTEISEYAFYGLSGVTEVQLPNSIKVIGDLAFFECHPLNAISIPVMIDSIGKWAFAGSPVSQIIPRVIPHSNNEAFMGSKVRSAVENNGMCYILNNSDNTAMLAPRSVSLDENGNIQYNVEQQYDGNIIIGDTVSFPNGKNYVVTGVSDYALSGCKNLTSVTLLGSVKNIGDKAFANSKIDYLYSEANNSFSFTAFENCEIDRVYFMVHQSELQALSELKVKRIFALPDDFKNIGKYVNCEILYSIPVINDFTPYMRGASFRVDKFPYMVMEGAKTIGKFDNPDLPDANGLYLIKNKEFRPKTNCSILLDYKIDGCPRSLEYEIKFKTKRVAAYAYVKNKTYTTLSVICVVEDDATWKADVLYFNNKRVENGELIKIEGLYPGQSYEYCVEAYMESDGSNNWVKDSVYYSQKGNFQTIPLNPQIYITNQYATSVEISGVYDKGDVLIDRTELRCNEIVLPDSYSRLTGLEPVTEYIVQYKVYYTPDDYVLETNSFTTPKLEFKTLPAKATSNTVALICAEANIGEDETNTGFEWRRYDAPDLVPSSSATCPVVDGVLTGALKNLSPQTYYKFRPYYTSASGKTYYGDWSAFRTEDAYVYFDPTVRTYAAIDINETSARIKGYAIAGSDAIVSQGFEYWQTASGKYSRVAGVNEVQTVTATGERMSVVLENLAPGTNYAYRSFAKTSSGVVYGEEQNFTTLGTPVGINDATVDNDVTEVARFTVDGLRITEPRKGINIVRYSDGTVRKVYVK